MNVPSVRRPVRIVLGGMAIVLLLVATRPLAHFIPAVGAKVQAFGTLAPIAFIVLYILAEVAFVPGTLLTIAGGAIFGLVWGTAFAMTGAMLGATAAFLLARHGLRGFVERRVRSSPALAALDGAIASDGRKLVFLARLAPVLPFNALNYAFGVTRIRLVDYLVGSIGIFPGTLLRAYYGHVVGDVGRLASGESPPRGPAHHVLLAVGLLATIGMTVVLARMAGPALHASAAAGADGSTPGGTPPRP